MSACLRAAQRHLARVGVSLFVALSMIAFPSRAQPQEIAVGTAITADGPGGGTTAARVVQAEPAQGTIAVDGRLDEPGWGAAQVARDFVQRRPDAGVPASQRSEVGVLYDADALYVGFRLFDTAPDSIVAALARRDYDGISDWAHVIIDSYHDRRTAFRFGINPAGVKTDAYLSGDQEGGADVAWDAVWDAATQRDSLGWTAELRIPLSQLRFSDGGAEPAATRTWGIQFARELARRGERSYWSPVPPDAGGFVSRFGRLEQLRVQPPRRLEIAPYTLARFTRSPGDAANPFYQANDLLGTSGADVKIGITPELTLTGTLHPDFGQVEADPSEVNLTGSETFLSERRPFFVEGSDIFQLPMGIAPWVHGSEQVFYSRRIGRAPRGSLPGDALFTERPQETTLLGAAKLSGRTAGGWSLGVLSAVAAEETGEYLDPSGVRQTATIEPLTNYALTRITRDFNGGGSAVGGVFTATNRRLAGGMEELLVSQAYVGGIDARHRFGNGQFEANGALLGSYIAGTADAVDRVMRNSVHYFQRPDATHLEYDPTRTSLGGISATGRVIKAGGGSWRGGLTGRLATAGFEANDLGYHPISDFARAHAWVGYEGLRSTPRVRRWSSWFNSWSTWNLGGDQLGSGAELYGSVELPSYWQIEGSVRREPDAISTTTLRGGPGLRSSARTTGSVRVTTDPRRAVNAKLLGRLALSDEMGGRSFRLEPTLTFRPSANVDLSLQPSLIWNRNPAQYVAQGGNAADRHYLVGNLRQTTASLMARVNYTFTPELSFQFYAQPFLSAGRYADFSEVGNPRAARSGDRFRPLSAAQISRTADGRYAFDAEGDGTAEFGFDDPDFKVTEFNSNAVLRWEYRPGSALFLVWSQGRSAEDVDGVFDLRRDVDRLLELPSTHTLQLKFSYWLGR